MVRERLLYSTEVENKLRLKNNNTTTVIKEKRHPKIPKWSRDAFDI